MTPSLKLMILGRSPVPEFKGGGSKKYFRVLPKLATTRNVAKVRQYFRSIFPKCYIKFGKIRKITAAISFNASTKICGFFQTFATFRIGVHFCNTHWSESYFWFYFLKMIWIFSAKIRISNKTAIYWKYQKENLIIESFYNIRHNDLQRFNSMDVFVFESLSLCNLSRAIPFLMIVETVAVFESRQFREQMELYSIKEVTLLKKCISVKNQ